MTNLIATTQPTYVTVSSGGEMLLTETLPVSGALATLLDVASSVDVNEYLSTVAAWSDQFEPLPGVGAPLIVNEMYRHGDGVVIVRQSHTRTEHEPNAVPALFLVAREPGTGIEWIAGESVGLGVQRTYGDVLYRARQAHVTQADWTPPSVPALWAEVVIAPPMGAWTIGVAYNVGDEVAYNGVTYRCRQAHTSIVTWEPPNVLALWLPL